MKRPRSSHSAVWIMSPSILALGTSSTGVEVAGSTHLNAPNCSVVANSVSSTAIELRSASSSVTVATLRAAGEIALQGIPIDPAAPPPEFLLSWPAMVEAPSVSAPYAGTLTHAFPITGMPTTPTSNVVGYISASAGLGALPVIGTVAVTE